MGMEKYDAWTYVFQNYLSFRQDRLLQFIKWAVTYVQYIWTMEMIIQYNEKDFWSSTGSFTTV